MWQLAWVGLVPWIAALRAASGWAAILGSWLAGVAFFGWLLYWLSLFGWTVWALACLILSLSWLAWGISARWLARLGPVGRMVSGAVLWCGIEWARGLGPFGFTWGWLGYSQSPALSLLPVARLGGTLLLSFLIVLANSALAEMVLALARRERVLVTAAQTLLMLAFVAAVALGAKEWAGRLSGPGGARLRVAIVQGSAHGPLRAEDVNVPLTGEERRRTLAIYEGLTEQAARQQPGIVIWPESVLPGTPDRDPLVAESVARAASSSKAWLLAGGPYVDEAGRQYNSAYLFAPSGNLVAHYDKVQLVPFGEYVPGREWLPFLGHYHVRETDFSPGVVHHLLQAGTTSLGPMICFESIFPQISWGLERKGAQLVVIITNDAWFGHTAAPAQHRQIAVLRAAETGLWVARAASTGISCLIAPNGRTVSTAGPYERAVLCEEVVLPPENEVHRSLGPLLSWLMLYLSLALLILPAVFRGGRRAVRGAPPGTRRRPRGRATPR